MNSFSLPPVLDSKDVLIEHLRAKLKSLISFDSILEELSVELCEYKSNQEIIELLKSEKILRESLAQLKTEGNTKQKLGTELFNSVSQHDTALCAQLTGMLLDLDILTICHLLCNPDDLEKAVIKAKDEYIKFKQESNKEYFGERIYPLVFEQHDNEELAARLTGMLLELDVAELQQLLENSDKFEHKLKLAFAAITSGSR